MMPSHALPRMRRFFLKQKNVTERPRKFNCDGNYSMIKRGDIVRIKPEWADPGDAAIDFLVTEDESKGRVSIMAMLGLAINPVQVVGCDMVDVVKQASNATPGATK